MTGIDFHFNLQDKLTYGCRLLRKAYARGAKLVVTGTLEQLTQLDALLWTFSSLEFVPHRLVTLPGDAASWQSTPVLLAESPEACPHRDVLVNLGLQAPQGFEHFERLIEVVTLADDDRLAARSRWKLYAERGYAVKHHDMAAAGAAV